MNCEEVIELLPAYVLGALEPDEVEAVEAHLRQGREHDSELIELRATVFALDRYREELITSPSPAPDARRSPAPAAQPRQPLAASRPAWAPLWRGVAAAVAALLLVGAGWLGASVLSGGDSFAVTVQDQTGAFMSVRGETSGDRVMVTMAGLERVPEGESYQVWAIREGEWVAIGTCNTNAEGRWRGDFEFQIRDGETVALTIEPAGGSDSPSGDVILSSAR
jgi:anti-sigma-K factor RskA